MNRPIVIGHQGNAGIAPPNTLAGFEEAIQLGADMIEVDLRVTADGEVVLFHDDEIDKHAGTPGKISEISLDELSRLDIGRWRSPRYAGQRIPTLAETLALAKDRIHLSLDLKTDDAIPRMAELIWEAGMLEQCIVCGCDARRALLVHEAEPKLAVVLNMEGSLKDLAAESPELFVREYTSLAIEAGTVALNLHYSYLTPELVRLAHLRGLSIWTWTVDEEADIRHVLGFGVDAIYSNWPGRVIGILDEYADAR